MANTSNYQENTIDFDYNYVRSNETDYTSLNAQDIVKRKAVLFGQDLLGGSYNILNSVVSFRPSRYNVARSDIDSVEIVGVTAEAVYYNDAANNTTSMRGIINNNNNTPQITTFIRQKILPFSYVPSGNPADELFQVGLSRNIWSKVSGGQFFHVYLSTANTIYTVGYNNFGQLGINLSTFNNTSTPVQVGNQSDWAMVVAGGQNVGAIKTNGTLWVWGNNSFGQLGQNDQTHRSSPVQVGTLSNWSKVSFGFEHCIATKTDGTLWAWGQGVSGQLGLSTRTSRSSPTQVGALTNWNNQIKAGNYFSSILKTDGTIWAMGYNGFGALGNGNTTFRSSPIQTGAGLNSWTQLGGQGTGIFAVRNDNTLWGCGYNQTGTLGDGTLVDKLNFVQLGNLTADWKLPILSFQNVGGGIKTNNTLWRWGDNGIVGPQGGFISLSTPVQLGSATNWREIASSYGTLTAIKTDNTLWVAGNNSYGQLGIFENGIAIRKISTGF